MIARPVPGRPAPGGGLAVLVVVTVLAVLAGPQLGRLRPLVDQLRQASPARILPPTPTPPAGGAGGRVCPVKGPVRIGQGWGAPRDGGRRRHQGIDLLAPAGTPLVAVASGHITRLSNRDRGRGGISLWLRDRRGTAYYYAHNQRTTWFASASGSGPGSWWPGSGPPATPKAAHPISTNPPNPEPAQLPRHEHEHTASHQGASMAHRNLWLIDMGDGTWAVCCLTCRRALFRGPRPVADRVFASHRCEPVLPLSRPRRGRRSA